MNFWCMKDLKMAACWLIDLSFFGHVSPTGCHYNNRATPQIKPSKSTEETRCLIFTLFSPTMCATRVEETIQMASENPMQKSANMYREHIEGIPKYEITPWPGLEALRKFMEKGYSRTYNPEMKKLVRRHSQLRI